MKIYRSLSVLIVGFLGATASVWVQASTILHIGAGIDSTTCATGSCGVYYNNGTKEVNPFTDHLSLVHNSSTTDRYALDGLYLVLGAVNDTKSGTAIVKSDFGKATFWSNGVRVPTIDVGYGPLTFKGLMKSGDEAYQTANLEHSNNSNSFKNWSGAEQSLLAIHANNFGIYTLQLTGVLSLGSKDLINIAFNNLPIGTFALGWGEVLSSTDKISFQGTAFTQTGLQMPPSSKVPEPSTLALLCLGFLGLVLMRRRSQQAG